MIAGCVVLYNPDYQVIENILSYVEYLSVLYVVDNSEEQNPDVLVKIKEISNIIYIANCANLGISTALNIGCERASEAGYSWILTMDQDTKFRDTTFFTIFKDSIEPDIAIFAASYTNDYDRWIKPYNKYFKEIHFAVTSGNLLHLPSWREIGKFEDKLFIDEVDHDFCIRARLKGYKILTSCDIFLQHGVGVELTNQGNRIFTGHSPIRYYYITRNMLYILKKFLFKDPALVYNRVRHFAKNAVKIMLYYPTKATYAKFIFKGIKDFMIGRYGKLNTR